MSREHVELVHRAVAAWNTRDIDRWLELTAPDVEVVFPQDVPEPGPFHGRDELRAWAEGFMTAWDDFEAEVRQAIPVGEQVVVELHQRGHGRETGIEMEQTDWHVFSVRDGRIVRWRAYWTREGALEAAGLRE
jgi:ketosteroid isomerase-like protein